MKKTLALLIASTALTTAIGVPAWSAMRAPDGTIAQTVAAVLDDAHAALPLIFVSDDDDDEREHRSGARHDDDDDDDDCDDDDCKGNARNPAPAGTVAPPQNGLFGNGALPQVQMK